LYGVLRGSGLVSEEDEQSRSKRAVPDVDGNSPASRSSNRGKQVRFQVREDCRLREQDFGQLQEIDAMAFTAQQRQKVGRFWFRPATGEAGADVYDRVSLFLDSMFRELDALRHIVEQQYHSRRVLESSKQKQQRPFAYDTVVIVTHGLTMRLLCMRYFRWTVREFEQVWNPDNAEMWVLEKMPNDGRYQLVYPAIMIGKERGSPMPLEMRTPRSISGELGLEYVVASVTRAEAHGVADELGAKLAQDDAGERFANAAANAATQAEELLVRDPEEELY